ncbi:MAG: FAD-dependent oxidoreductase [Anderseniella sp.]
MSSPLLILGGGVTGLGAAWASRAPVLESRSQPGGICASYYFHPQHGVIDEDPDGECFTFEIGGGHWLFGANPDALEKLGTFSEFERFERKSAVYLPQYDRMVPYPIQQNLRLLPRSVAEASNREMQMIPRKQDGSFHDWLLARFGPTLGEEFFLPFNDLYTAGMTRQIAAQDSYKSPPSLSPTTKDRNPAGYNARFRYPKTNLGHLFNKLAEKCDVRYSMEVTEIDVASKTLKTRCGQSFNYQKLLATLPLNILYKMAFPDREADLPYTSILVLNLAGRRTEKCPSEQWIYFPKSCSGFHRVGFYSNVSDRFLPVGLRDSTHASAYVERSWKGGCPPTKQELNEYIDSAKQELVELGWFSEISIVHETWVEVAYTYEWLKMNKSKDMIKELEAMDVHPIGRYGRWNFQGILESFSEGLLSGHKARENL